jgi:hypothetical protein
MRILLILTVVLAGCSVCQGEEAVPFDGWVLPGAKPVEQSTSSVTSTPVDTHEGPSATSGFGQYETAEPFHEVVAFYVGKSGLEPPNWSILGREYPGTDVHMPAHFSRTDFSGKDPSVTLLHNIRDGSAAAHLLVSDHPTLGSITVAITRGRGEDRTVIQLIQHSAKRIERGIERTEARDTAAESVAESGSAPQSP